MGASKKTKARDGANIVVVYGSPDEEHAAHEFGKYASKLTGRDIEVLSDRDAKLEAYARVVSVGTNQINDAFIQQDLLEDYRITPNKDRFIVKTISHDGREYLVLTGYGRRATLYAVYHYLESFCGAGFFQDGERIPTGQELVFSGIDLVEEPRFSHRCTHFADRPLLDRFFSGFWNLETWKRQLDWAVKGKLNTVVLEWSAPGAFEKAFPECKDTKPPVPPWGWPAKYSADLRAKVLAYARKIGLSSIYWLAYGVVPAQFKDAHPELEYHADVWPDYMSRAINLCAAQPECKEIMRKYWSAIIQQSGTDHKYTVNHMLSERRGCDKLDPSGRGIKVDAIVQAYEVLKSIDADAEVHYWTWDLGVAHSFDMSIAQAYLWRLPKDMVISDSWAWEPDWGWEPERKARDKFNHPFASLYFGGRRWVLELWYAPSFGDVLHGGFQHSIDLFSDVIDDPKATRCIGVNLGAEITNHNICLTQLLAELSWNPAGIGLDEYLRSYVTRRYGRESSGNMLKSYRRLVDAVEHIRSFHPDHRLIGDLPQALGPHNPYSLLAAGIYSEGNRSCWKKDEESIGLLEEALRLAGKERDKQVDNELYGRYLLELERTHLHFVIRYHFAQAYFAYHDATVLIREGGDLTKLVARFEEQAGVVVDCLNRLQAMFERRKEFSLDRMLKEEVMAVPGTSPDTPSIVREHSLYLATSFYNSTSCLELLRDVFKPMITTIIEILRERLRSRETQFIEVDMLFYATEYWNKPWAIDRGKQNPKYVERIKSIIEGFIKGNGTRESG